MTVFPSLNISLQGANEDIITALQELAANPSQIWSSPVIADDGAVYFSAQVSTIEGTVSSRLFKIQVNDVIGDKTSKIFVR
jgi:hypothetical protein